MNLPVCPFCGGEVKISQEEVLKGFSPYCIVHAEENSQCTHKGKSYFSTEKQAAVFWKKFIYYSEEYR